LLLASKFVLPTIERTKEAFKVEGDFLALDTDEEVEERLIYYNPNVNNS
jgi:hypothetical protein